MDVLRDDCSCSAGCLYMLAQLCSKLRKVKARQSLVSRYNLQAKELPNFRGTSKSRCTTLQVYLVASARSVIRPQAAAVDKHCAVW